MPYASLRRSLPWALGAGSEIVTTNDKHKFSRLNMYSEISFDEFKKLYSVDFLLVTVTDVELRSSLYRLAPIEENDQIIQVYIDNITIYFGLFGKYTTAIVRANSMGSLQMGGSIQTCTEAINKLIPKALIMVGIAFGKSDRNQNIGDVLVSKGVCIYDPSRVNEDGSIDYRGSTPESNLTLFNRFTQDSEHNYSFNEKRNTARIIGGLLLSGERLVDNKQYKQQLFDQYPSAVGGEMEGAGVYAVCATNNIPWILVKSICDWGDGNKVKEYQERCAYIANSYLHSKLMSLEAFRSLSIFPYNNKSSESQEIVIDAIDILKILIPRKYWPHIPSSMTEVKDAKKKIYYQYYMHENKGRSEGYLFLGRNITLVNTFEDFSSRFSPPNTISVYLTKMVKRGQLVNRLRGIKDKSRDYGLARSDSWEVNYVDDVVWDSTADLGSDFVHSRRNDYIDQALFPNSSQTDGDSLGKSVDFFREKILNPQGSSNSIVFGSGGVGKTTFCDALVNEFDLNSKEYRKKVLIIRGERISQIKGGRNIYVESLMDLYSLYESDLGEVGYDYDEFRLNYICGNVVVVIDGLDEIDSALGENFNLESFFDSLVILDEKFYNTKIIITTRDYFEETLLLKARSFESYRLMGFTDSDLDTYLNFRLKDKALASRAKSFLEEKKLAVDDYFVPMLADWVCEIVLRDDKKINSGNFLDYGKYFLKEIVFDEILVDLINRENEKQSINCSVDEMFELLSEIIVQHSGCIGKEDLDEYVRITFDEDVEKYLKNPLFKISSDGEKISIKYDALISIIKSRYLRVHLKNRISFSDNTIKLMKETFDGKSSLLDDLLETLDLKHNESVDMVRFYVDHLLLKLKAASSNSDKRNIHKCLSGLTYIAFKNSKGLTKKERSILIKELYSSGSTIHKFHIFGEFYPIDLTDMIFMESSFTSYDNLDECYYPENESPIFTYCTFDGTNILKKCEAKSHHFETTCTYINSNIQDAIEGFENEHDIYIDQIKKNLVSITRYIGNSEKSMNLLKRHTNIKWVDGHRGFIEVLERKGFLKANNQKHYSIDGKYIDSISNIKHGTIPSVVEELIFSISSSSR